MRAFNIVAHFVLDSDVGECALGHYDVVASSCSISVEIFLLDSVACEPFGGSRVAGDVTCRRNVVGSNIVAYVYEAVCVLDAVDWSKFLFCASYERRVGDIG